VPPKGEYMNESLQKLTFISPSLHTLHTESQHPPVLAFLVIIEQENRYATRF